MENAANKKQAELVNEFPNFSRREICIFFLKTWEEKENMFRPMRIILCLQN